MEKNIIIITDYAAPYEGNFIASIKALEKVAKNKNYKMKFLFSKRAMNIEWVTKFSAQYDVEFFDEGIFDVIKILSKSMKEGVENILYSHFARHKTQVAIKIFKMVRRNFRLVQHFHNHCKIPKKFPKKQLMELAYRLYEGDLNIGCSESVMKSMPYNPRKNVFVNNAIDFSRLSENNDMNKIKNQKKEFIILMFGFDYYRKGVDIAINAVKNIADEKKITLVISLASNYEKIENIIKGEFQKIPDWIKLLPSNENVSEYYNMADIFLSSAREEGFCYSLVEATYCGTRCISSKIGGVPLDIPGIISFESENIEDLKNKILWSLENNENKLEEAKKYIVEKYDLNKWAEEVMKKLED